MTDETRSAPGRPVRDDVGWDDLTEDVFGLSIRGLVTIRDLAFRPARVFVAARQTRWSRRYTPSLRLVASLVALMLILRVFWAAEHTMMYQNVLQMLELAAERNPEIGDPTELAPLYFSAWALSFPFVYFVLHVVSGLLVRIWGRGTSTPVRLRLYFAALVPGLCFSIVWLAIFPWLPTGLALAVGMIVVTLAAVIYAGTAYFGIRDSAGSVGTRLWRGALFALVASLTDTLVAISAGVVGSLLMEALRHGYAVPGLG